MSLDRDVPRIVGLLSLTFVPFLLRLDLALAVIWVACCAILATAPALTRAGSIVLAGLAGLASFFMAPGYREPLLLLMWVCFIIAVTVGRADDRARLLRWCVTALYAFTAASKLNPDFLNADQLLYLVDTRAHLEFLRPVVASDWGSVLAIGTIITEAWLAVGLWIPRTRRLTMMLGIGFHATLIMGATGDVESAGLLVLLNGLCVLSYAGFVHKPRVTEAAPQPLPVAGSVKHVDPTVASDSLAVG